LRRPEAEEGRVPRFGVVADLPAVLAATGVRPVERPDHALRQSVRLEPAQIRILRGSLHRAAVELAADLDEQAGDSEQAAGARPRVAQVGAVLRRLRRVGVVSRADADAVAWNVGHGRILVLHEDLVVIELHAHADLELVAEEVVAVVRIARIRRCGKPFDELAAQPVIELDTDSAAEGTLSLQGRDDASTRKHEPALLGRGDGGSGQRHCGGQHQPDRDDAKQPTAAAAARSTQFGDLVP